MACVYRRRPASDTNSFLLPELVCHSSSIQRQFAFHVVMKNNVLTDKGTSSVLLCCLLTSIRCWEKMVIHSLNASCQHCELELSMYNLCCTRYNGEHCVREKSSNYSCCRRPRNQSFIYIYIFKDEDNLNRIQNIVLQSVRVWLNSVTICSLTVFVNSYKNTWVYYRNTCVPVCLVNCYKVQVASH